MKRTVTILTLMAVFVLSSAFFFAKRSSITKDGRVIVYTHTYVSPEGVRSVEMVGIDSFKADGNFAKRQIDPNTGNETLLFTSDGKIYDSATTKKTRLLLGDMESERTVNDVSKFEESMRSNPQYKQEDLHGLKCFLTERVDPDGTRRSQWWNAEFGIVKWVIVNPTGGVNTFEILGAFHTNDFGDAFDRLPIDKPIVVRPTKK